MKRKTFNIIKQSFIVLAVIGIVTVIVRAVDEKVVETEIGQGPCGTDMVLVSAPGGGFCIDRYEAAPAEKCPYGDPGGSAQTKSNLDMPGCVPVSKAGITPWRNISQDQAALACAKAGKRLPTNMEWLAAALGTPDRERGWGAEDCQVAGNWTAQPGLTGSGSNCVSAAGAYDMIGNVWEWVQGAVADGSYEGQALPPQGYIDGTDGASLPGATNPDRPNPEYDNDYFWHKSAGLRGIVRGGYWDNGDQAGTYSVYAVTPPNQAGAGIGFRCVK